tara:strand:+ start:6382 stop:6672 length:291 start_codon:yes stop_codon:yes gene_type:complete
MLEYEEDEGILWLATMLSSEIKESNSKDLVCSIDDCDCAKCISDRGGLDADRLLYLQIPIGDGKVVYQRLSLEEANMLGRALIAYSENLSNMLEEE